MIERKLDDNIKIGEYSSVVRGKGIPETGITLEIDKSDRYIDAW